MIIGVRNKVTKQLIGYITTTDIVPPKTKEESAVQRIVESFGNGRAEHHVLTQTIEEAKQYAEHEAWHVGKTLFDTDTTESFAI